MALSSLGLGLERIVCVCCQLFGRGLWRLLSPLHCTAGSVLGRGLFSAAGVQSFFSFERRFVIATLGVVVSRPSVFDIGCWPACAHLHGPFCTCCASLAFLSAGWRFGCALDRIFVRGSQTLLLLGCSCQPRHRGLACSINKLITIRAVACLVMPSALLGLYVCVVFVLAPASRLLFRFVLAWHCIADAVCAVLSFLRLRWSAHGLLPCISLGVRLRVLRRWPYLGSAVGGGVSCRFKGASILLALNDGRRRDLWFYRKLRH